MSEALSWAGLAGSALLLLALIAFVNWAGLGLGRRLLVAAIRATLQLSLIGLVLGYVFAWRSPWMILLFVLVATGAAAYTAWSRQEQVYSGLLWHVGIGLVAGAWTVTGFAVSLGLQLESWYDPQYVIPIVGMILGNGLNGLTIGLDRAFGLWRDRDVMELRLSLGATRWQAAWPAIRKGLHDGLVPVTNTMLVAGVVSLPGMMTGQILAGAAPADAVRYQLFIMFLIAVATALAVIVTMLLAGRVVLNSHHQLAAGPWRARSRHG